MGYRMNVKKMKRVYSEFYGRTIWVEDFDHEDLLNTPHAAIFTVLGIFFGLFLLYLWS